MKLSVLDQSPVLTGFTPGQALEETAKLVQSVEELGYSRFWVSEHHQLDALAGSSPEVLLAHLGARTTSIRIGAGAVLLPYYSPLKVAENFNLLATLYPGRIDLGIGRAPGGSAHTSLALRENYLQNVFRMPELVKELQDFLLHTAAVDHAGESPAAYPIPPVQPELWMLGTSSKSAGYASELGAAFAFGHFMSDGDGPEIIKQYRQSFTPSSALRSPKSLIAVSVICAQTSEQAEQLAVSQDVWSIRMDAGQGRGTIPTIEEAANYPFTAAEKTMVRQRRERMIIGNPRQVREKLLVLEERYQTEEFMIVTITPSYEARQRSYELLAEAILK
ncbi:LLM class flavin-dependent oxidoreductase [Aneurinibacillus sp. Ricciae_BoGa-3]|uniref:LLM class flavin-dependent oxidoreductase n=1 Tax=Aneurinibacillus sp. Ricciae_BoGa-3 TaxID=3022697 RepID=UPI00234211A9|nr:LLM class flavin-dependent oxidoreductase [Aneurinibacillus sp. Ricciae_BoGa-3]WCK52790.1 LLM class flavin-dependent oxidoreductase [Aneurinibacillus sp. Ricciae_BoGa-3]